MAWLEQDPSGVYHVAFRFAHRKFKRSLDTKTKRRAEARRLRLEENIGLVKAGRLEIPDGADPAAFLLSDGKLSGKPTTASRITLSSLFDHYWNCLPSGSHEPETIRIAKVHERHLRRLIGKSRSIDSLSPTVVQGYINRRSQESRAGKHISPTTIKKEVATLRVVWNWALGTEIISVGFPKKLKYPKVEEKEPFQTWQEIERRIASTDTAEIDAKQLWDSLYLDLDQIGEVLSAIKQRAAYGFVYPMASMAAYTGARRSEICRARTSDADLGSSTILIREKKKSQSRRTSRRVPISEPFRKVLEHWITEKRESPWLFPADHRVARKRRSRQDEDAVSADEASYHLDAALSKTKWQVLRGWHIFRHSFCSNCATAGIDQRMIDAWMGHQTDEMRKRYRHLFPDAQHAVLNKLFTASR